MPTEVKMPQMGETITEGIVSRWLKQAGERVEQYEPLLEVETDKVNSEVPAPAGGTLLRILVPEGEKVPVGAVLALIGEGEPAAASTWPDEAGFVRSLDHKETPEDSPVRPNRMGTAAVLPESDTKLRLTPVVARLAAEHKLDIRQIPGTGRGGRVSKQDVLRFLEQQMTAAPVESLPPPEATPLPADASLMPLTGMRRAIAEHMVRSIRTAPQVTTVFEIDMSRVIAHRQQRQASFEQQGVRLTLTPYFCQAVVTALQAVPILNGRYTDEGIIMQRRIHLGLAVALPEGLIVPVIRDAAQKNLLGLASAVNDLAERARNGKLRPDETQGGTFTITNHGVNGSLFSNPIINQPQSGIMGVGAVVKRPVVVSYEGLDSLAIKPICFISLTFDHRLIDGATADSFMGVVKQTLEQYDDQL
jgi:2-oxoglutarate dehydrogenase E2 component (dihydrolipoamide succinyltransferase)